MACGGKGEEVLLDPVLSDGQTANLHPKWTFANINMQCKWVLTSVSLKVAPAARNVAINFGSFPRNAKNIAVLPSLVSVVG